MYICVVILFQIKYMNPEVTPYFSEGCGRCALGGTPECKVHRWPKELKHLRNVILECGLVEELKWGVPCYTHNKANIAILAAFKDYCALSFFKGSLLHDEQKILHSPGENSQASRLFKFTSIKEITKLERIIKAYIFEAIEIENAGLKVKFKKAEEYPIPVEFELAMKKNPALQKAFYALTPGRQKGYLLHFSQAKQAATREARIEKYTPKILMGKGMMD